MTFATVSVSASGLLGSFSCGAVEGSQRRFRISLLKWRYEVPGSALYSGHASVQTSGFSLTLRNRGKGGWARDLRGRRQNCLPRYSAGVKSRSVVLGYPS